MNQQPQQGRRANNKHSLREGVAVFAQVPLSRSFFFSLSVDGSADVRCSVCVLWRTKERGTHLLLTVGHMSDLRKRVPGQTASRFPETFLLSLSFPSDVPVPPAPLCACSSSCLGLGHGEVERVGHRQSLYEADVHDSVQRSCCLAQRLSETVNTLFFTTLSV